MKINFKFLYFLYYLFQSIIFFETQIKKNLLQLTKLTYFPQLIFHTFYLIHIILRVSFLVILFNFKFN